MELNERESIEIWKSVPEYEGLYEVSNQGRVRSLDRKYATGGVIKGRILKPHNDKGGYSRVKLSKNGKVRSLYVHRLVAQAFLLIVNGKQEIHHKDHDKHNNHVDNLQWVTRSENIVLAYEFGAIKKKLTNEEEEYIRKHYKQRDKKYGANALAKKFGVRRQHIYTIANRIG